MSFATAGRELAAFQKSSYAATIGLGLELRDNRHPVFDVGGLPAARIDESPQVGHDALHGADEEMPVVDAVREHVAHFPGGGQFFHLPPAEVSRVPILEALGAEMVGLSNVPALDQVVHVLH